MQIDPPLLTTASPGESLRPSLYRGAALEREKVQVMLKAVADSTSRTYAASWGQWTQFERLRDREAFLLGEDGARLDEVCCQPKVKI